VRAASVHCKGATREGHALTENVSGLPPAGWYPDPERPGLVRYWDGHAWGDVPVVPTVLPGAAQAPTAAPPPMPGPQAPHVPAPAVPTDGFAVTALVTGLVGFIVPLLSFVAIGFGIAAKRRIRRTRAVGNGMATAGITLGVVAIVGYILLAALIATLVIASQRSSQGTAPSHTDEIVVRSEALAIGLAVQDCWTSTGNLPDSAGLLQQCASATTQVATDNGDTVNYWVRHDGLSFCVQVTSAAGANGAFDSKQNPPSATTCSNHSVDQQGWTAILPPTGNGGGATPSGSVV